jgi:hypothetical protein
VAGSGTTKPDRFCKSLKSSRPAVIRWHHRPRIFAEKINETLDPVQIDIRPYSRVRTAQYRTMLMIFFAIAGRIGDRISY